MKSEKNCRNDNRTLVVLIALTCLLLLALMFAGCGTVAPKPVTAEASWDGTNRNSGFIGWTTNGYGILTPHAHERYNALIEFYGDKFKPKLEKNYGTLEYMDGNYLFTPEAISDFAAMNRWRRMEGK